MLAGLLDQFCQKIEITESQYMAAKASYEAVGKWLSDAESPHLELAKIYPQGSVALGTATKPLAGNEFDVDLVCHLPTLSLASDARAVKGLIGDRLKTHATYKHMLEEKQRCWRLNYANEYHLDITPSILNPRCPLGGELVPDRSLAAWKATNPKGYISKFDQYAALNPRFILLEHIYAEARARAEVSPLPDQQVIKPLLKRIVQLLKRHRDQKYLGTAKADSAPISVIITTLAAWAYAKCTSQNTHADAFDFIVSVIREMPNFIRIDLRSGRPYFIVENETTTGENFAEKWNSDVRLAQSFYEWHADVLTSVESLTHIEGADRFAECLSSKFGAQKELVKETLATFISPINHARSAGLLAVAPAVGLISRSAHGAVVVPKNTFFGRHRAP